MSPIVPNLFIIGVPKAGRSSMQRWLGDHPEIAPSSHAETRYLMDAEEPLSRKDGYAVNGLDGYSKYFPTRPGSGSTKYLLDVTPQYYYQRTALNVIKRLDNKKIIFLLRKPSSRLFSLYKYAKNNIGCLPIQMTFSQFIDEIKNDNSSKTIKDRPMLKYAIDHSKYVRYLDIWTKTLKREDFTVLIFEELIADTKNIVKNTASRLSVDIEFYDTYLFPKENESYRVRSPGIHRLMRYSKNKVPRPLREALKGTYNRFNTERFDGQMTSDDQATIRYLDHDFLPWEKELSSFLGRTTMIWSNG